MLVALTCSEGQDCCTTVGIVSGVQDWVLAVWCARLGAGCLVCKTCASCQVAAEGGEQSVGLIDVCSADSSCPAVHDWLRWSKETLKAECV